MARLTGWHSGRINDETRSVMKGGADDFPGLSSGRTNDEARSKTKNTSPSLASIVNNVPSRPAPVINPNFSSTKEVIPMRGIHLLDSPALLASPYFCLKLFKIHISYLSATILQF